jgi:hypothetical protein
VTPATPVISGFTLSSNSVVYGTAAPTITSTPSSLSTGAITYTSSNTGIAIIDLNTGAIAIVGAGGPVTFTATQAANGNYGEASATTSLTVTPATPVLSGFTLSSNSVILGQTAPTKTAPTSASSGVITYTSDNPSVATINLNTGIITLVGLGSVTFTATQAANGNYGQATATTSLTVTAAADPGYFTVNGVTSTPPTPGGFITYTQAFAYCDALEKDGKEWRLPTFTELIDLNTSLVNAGFNLSIPTGWSMISQTWSSTPAAGGGYRTIYMPNSAPVLSDSRRDNGADNAITLCVTSQ